MRRSLHKLLHKYRIAVIAAAASMIVVLAANAIPVLMSGAAPVKNGAGRSTVFGEAIPIIGGVYIGDAIRVLDNFSVLTLEREEPSLTAYFDVTDIFGKGEPVTDQAVADRASDFIGKRFKLVASKNDASFLIMVRAVPGYMDYAIRNRHGVPSNAQVTILICRLRSGGVSAIDQSKDCRNTDYKVFGQEPMREKLQAALDLWWKELAPNNPSAN